MNSQSQARSWGKYVKRLAAAVIQELDSTSAAELGTGRCVPSYLQMESVIGLAMYLRGINPEYRRGADADLVKVSVLHPIHRLIPDVESRRLAMRGGRVGILQPFEVPSTVELLFPVDGDSVRIVWYRNGLALRAEVFHHKPDQGLVREVALDFGVDPVHQGLASGRTWGASPSVGWADPKVAHELARGLIVRGLSTALDGCKLLLRFFRTAALAGDLRTGKPMGGDGPQECGQDFTPRAGHAGSVAGHGNGGKG